MHACVCVPDKTLCFGHICNFMESVEEGSIYFVLPPGPLNLLGGTSHKSDTAELVRGSVPKAPFAERLEALLDQSTRSVLLAVMEDETPRLRAYMYTWIRTYIHAYVRTYIHAQVIDRIGIEKKVFKHTKH